MRVILQKPLFIQKHDVRAKWYNLFSWTWRWKHYPRTRANRVRGSAYRKRIPGGTQRYGSRIRKDLWDCMMVCQLNFIKLFGRIYLLSFFEHWIDFPKSPLSCLFSTRRSSFAQPLRGLTYCTLKFMRSTCGKSSVQLKVKYISQFLKRVSRVEQKAMYHWFRSF